MPDGERIEAHKGSIAGVQNRSLDIHSVDGIWSVQHNEIDAHLATGFHGECHRIDESVVSSTYILEVEKEQVEARQHLGCWFTMFAVKAVYRQTGPLISKTLPFNHVVLGFSTGAVLRSEHG